VFWVNSGAEANENAFKLAFKMRPGRTHVAAVEQSFHGRTAACASTTWNAPQKWFFLPRAPFDVSWIRRRDVADIAHHVTDNTAAVIVEPVQGVGGAFDMGQEFLAALRKRCDETGALLIFDEVQCGVGRSGTPFAANYYGVMPDMITTAKALGNGFPVSALLLTAPVTASLKLENLGTTFGGGPMACAVADATLAAIEKEDLLANVVRVSRYLTSTCKVGPVLGFQGLGFLAGLKMNKPAKDIQKALLARDILAGTAGDPSILRLLPAFILKEEHIDLLRAALVDL
jgi:acetylornithine/N-succinyldiaminopimelate aminotransferase